MPTKKPTIKDLERKLANANDALEAALALSPERDNNFFTGGLSSAYENRNSWDRKKVFAEALRAWRVNPIARRIVKLTTSFIIGKGVKIISDNAKAQTFLSDWWHHPLNNFDKNIRRWMDESTRTGNLFALFNVSDNGMTIIRMVPAEQIEEIVTAENDIEQEIRYTRDAVSEEGWEAYDPNKEQDKFMLHFAINQPVGSVWGEGDLVPMLVWIGRYSSWLEDRVRLNRFRTAYVYTITGNYRTEQERKTREKEINSNPPKPGSVLVLSRDGGEEWDTKSPKLDSSDANTDGLAIKKMIAAGIGFPLHYLAEPESATRTTAEAAGTPTFRTLEEMQDEFFSILTNMAHTACKVKGIPSGEIKIEGPDITERDNATLALALGRAYPQLIDLYDREGISADEFMRLTYKMLAEVWEGKTPTIKRKPLVQPTAAPQTPAIDDDKSDETDPPDNDSLAARFAEIAMRAQEPANIVVNVPEQPPATINVNVPEPNISVEMKTPKQTRQPVIVNVAAPKVDVKNEIKMPEVTESLVVERDAEGRATRIEKKIK